MYYVLAVKPHPTLPSGEPSYFFWTGTDVFSADKSDATKARYKTHGRAQNAAKSLFDSKRFSQFCAIIPCHESSLPGIDKDKELDLSYLDEDDCTY